MTRETKILRFFVLVMAKITVGFSAVMPILVGVVRLYVSGFLSQFYRLTMTAQTFFHRYRFGFFHLSVALGTFDTLAGMQFT